MVTAISDSTKNYLMVSRNLFVRHIINWKVKLVTTRNDITNFKYKLKILQLEECKLLTVNLTEMVFAKPPLENFCFLQCLKSAFIVDCSIMVLHTMHA